MPENTFMKQPFNVIVKYTNFKSDVIMGSHNDLRMISDIIGDHCVTFDMREDRVYVTFNEEEFLKRIPEINEKLETVVEVVTEEHLYILRELTIIPILLLEEGIIKSTLRGGVEAALKRAYKCSITQPDFVGLILKEDRIGAYLKDVSSDNLKYNTLYQHRMKSNIIGVRKNKKDGKDHYQQFVDKNVMCYFL